MALRFHEPLPTFLADLHLHSRYSYATSRDLDLEGMAAHAERKGIRLLGTGDFTHPAWRAGIEERLEPAEPGLFRLAGGNRTTRFMLQVEISTVYRREGRARRVHHLVYVPDLRRAHLLSTRLATRGRLDADGRPTLRLDSRDLLEMVLECGEDCFLVPAHIWTPWYSVLGSRSGFDAIEECYRDLAPRIFAVETGLSSDPAMNRRVSRIDRFTLVSGSDAHSPGRIGREATAFRVPLSYFSVMEALRTGKGHDGTVEFFPEEGKYHLDGCRRCGVRRTPGESRRNLRCPSCGRGMTIGVLHRVLQLADRREPLRTGSFRRLVPLHEILSELTGRGPRTRRVGSLAARILDAVGPELHVLGTAPLERVDQAGIPHLSEALRRMRRGRVIPEPGYDGKPGAIRLFGEAERARVRAAIDRIA